MITSITHTKKTLQIDLSKPIDISIPLRGDQKGVGAWYLPPPSIEPHQKDDFIGSVEAGASVNFRNVWFNPHAHITHTECVGHITKEVYSINQYIKPVFCLAELLTIAPERQQNDLVISKKQLQNTLKGKQCEALIIRTLPNTQAKLNRQYTNTNPPYLLEETAVYLRENGIKHLLIDLPSIDKEYDEGRLLAHKAFWNFEGTLRHYATITEFIYADNSIDDGTYILNLQIAPFENDASPSRPILYQIM